MPLCLRFVTLGLCALAIAACAGADEIETDGAGFDSEELVTELAPAAELGQRRQAMMDDGHNPIDCSTCVGGGCVGCFEQWTHGSGSGSGGPYDPPGGGGGYMPGDVGTRPSTSGSCIAPACKSSCMAQQRRCRSACGADETCSSDCGSTADCIDLCCS